MLNDSALLIHNIGLTYYNQAGPSYYIFYKTQGNQNYQFKITRSFDWFEYQYESGGMAGGSGIIYSWKK